MKAKEAENHRETSGTHFPEVPLMGREFHAGQQKKTNQKTNKKQAQNPKKQWRRKLPSGFSWRITLRYWLPTVFCTKSLLGPAQSALIFQHWGWEAEANSAQQPCSWWVCCLVCTGCHLEGIKRQNWKMTKKSPSYKAQNKKEMAEITVI